MACTRHATRVTRRPPGHDRDPAAANRLPRRRRTGRRSCSRPSWSCFSAYWAWSRRAHQDPCGLWPMTAGPWLERAAPGDPFPNHQLESQLTPARRVARACTLCHGRPLAGWAGVLRATYAADKKANRQQWRARAGPSMHPDQFLAHSRMVAAVRRPVGSTTASRSFAAFRLMRLSNCGQKCRANLPPEARAAIRAFAALPRPPLDAAGDEVALLDESARQPHGVVLSSL